MAVPLLHLLSLLGILSIMAAAETVRHRRHLRRIPIRVHVNGTRGKSSVTRLIAAGLRAGGMRTVAKTTGTLPRLILPDGSEIPIVRQARANVIEQRDVIAAAARVGAEVLVVECMALQPRLQWLCESKLVRATHGVITNAWPDHLDVMGPRGEDVARALANMTPVGGTLFTAEEGNRDVLRHAAADRNSRFIHVGPVEVEEVSSRDMEGFRYDEHKENVAIALRVCQELGVSRDAALSGMQLAAPDPGATTTHRIEYCGRAITFVNAFAANDPVATGKAWRRALTDTADAARRIAIFNCREDRPDRSVQLARACVHWPPADHYVLLGTGTNVFARAARRAGLDPRRIVSAGNANAAELFELVLDLTEDRAVVVGMGNIGDHGLDVARYFRNRGSTTARETVVANAAEAPLRETAPAPAARVSLAALLRRAPRKLNGNGRRLSLLPANGAHRNGTNRRPANGSANGSENGSAPGSRNGKPKT